MALSFFYLVVRALLGALVVAAAPASEDGPALRAGPTRRAPGPAGPYRGQRAPTAPGIRTRNVSSDKASLRFAQARTRH
jgi:hypothetical protein